MSYFNKMFPALSVGIITDILSANLKSHQQLTDSSLAVKRINTDSRGIGKGDVFLALRGERFDGHEFVEQAIAQGAVAAIVDHALPLAVPQLIVSDSLVAYQQLAHWWRNQLDIPVIAVTGSCGKTTTKELISAVLSRYGNVLKTQANFNNEIGVPKTLLELRPDHDFAVVEMAMRGPGQIALLAEIAAPTLGVITNVGTAHIGLLGSEEAIAQAKCELLAEMPKTSTAILNADNLRLMETAKTVWRGQTLTYGLEGGDITGTWQDSDTLEVEGLKLPLPLAGRHNASNYLAAIAVAQVLGLDWQSLQQGLTVELPPGRAKQYQLPDDIVVLDETYNAGLESMMAALALLAQTPGNRHLAVLGTMKELGTRSPEFHRRIGETARHLNLDYLLVLVDDPEAAEIATGAQGIGCELFSSHQAICSRLLELVKGGDRILFKASHSVGLDQVVQQFLQHHHFS